METGDGENTRAVEEGGIRNSRLELERWISAAKPWGSQAQLHTHVLRFIEGCRSQTRWNKDSVSEK